MRAKVYSSIVVPVLIPGPLKLFVEDMRQILQADQDYYVDNTTGNDNNIGSAAAPWATLQKANDYISQNIDFNNFNITVHIATSGTPYAGVTTTYLQNTGTATAGHGVTGAALYWLGDNTTPSNVQITSNAYNGASDCFHLALNSLNGNINVYLAGVRFVQTSGACVSVPGEQEIFTMGAPGGGAVKIEVAGGQANGVLWYGNVHAVNVTGTIVGASLPATPLRAFIWAHTTCSPLFSDSTVFTITGTATVSVALIWIDIGATPTTTTAVLDVGAFSGTVTGGSIYMNGANSILIINGGAKESVPGSTGITHLQGIIQDTNGTYEALESAHVESATLYQRPSSGFSITLSNGNGTLLVDPSSALASGTIQMCPDPLNGQHVHFTFSEAISSMTFSPNSSQSVKDAPTVISSGQYIHVTYNSSDKTWYFGL